MTDILGSPLYKSVSQVYREAELFCDDVLNEGLEEAAMVVASQALSFSRIASSTSSSRCRSPTLSPKSASTLAKLQAADAEKQRERDWDRHRQASRQARLDILKPPPVSDSGRVTESRCSCCRDERTQKLSHGLDYSGRGLYRHSRRKGGRVGECADAESSFCSSNTHGVTVVEIQEPSYNSSRSMSTDGIKNGGVMSSSLDLCLAHLAPLPIVSEVVNVSSDATQTIGDLPKNSQAEMVSEGTQVTFADEKDEIEIPEDHIVIEKSRLDNLESLISTLRGQIGMLVASKTLIELTPFDENQPFSTALLDRPSADQEVNKSKVPSDEVIATIETQTEEWGIGTLWHPSRASYLKTCGVYAPRHPSSHAHRHAKSHLHTPERDAEVSSMYIKLKRSGVSGTNSRIARRRSGLKTSINDDGGGLMFLHRRSLLGSVGTGTDHFDVDSPYNPQYAETPIEMLADKAAADIRGAPQNNPWLRGSRNNDVHIQMFGLDLTEGLGVEPLSGRSRRHCEIDYEKATRGILVMPIKGAQSDEYRKTADRNAALGFSQRPTSKSGGVSPRRQARSINAKDRFDPDSIHNPDFLTQKSGKQRSPSRSRGTSTVPHLSAYNWQPVDVAGDAR